MTAGGNHKIALVYSEDPVLRALMDALAASGPWRWRDLAADEAADGVAVALVDVDGPLGSRALPDVRARLGAAVPLVAVESSAAGDLAALFAAGADDVLLRPLTSQNLALRLDVVSRHARLGRPTMSRVGDEGGLHYRAVLDALAAPVFLVSEMSLLYANRAASDMLGYASPDVLVGKDIEQLVLPDELHDARERLRRAQSKEGGPVPGIERRARRANGEVVTLAIAPLRRVVLGGRPVVVVMARDVTEERMVEARLRLADRLTSVGTLAAGVAHEVNNPLATVVANLSVLEEELPILAATQPAEERQELIEILADARTGADRVQQIVRDLSTFAKVDATTLGLVDVNRVVEATLNIAAPQIRHRAMVVKVLESVGSVRGNEARLGQVLLHLVLNAVQAMPSGRVSENELRVRTESDGARWVIIEVEDTGRGMPQEEKHRIFEPFFTTKPVGEGIGLGLSISHSIIEQMGGHIDVESRPGVGSRFTVRLPAAARERRTTPDALPAGLPRSASILVVDDEPMITRSLGRLLKGHEVTVARSGREAVQLLTSQAYDLVVCDLNMPDLTGIDVYERVQLMRPGEEERIVFMTGGAFTPETAAFLDSIPNIWIEKPFDFKAVRALLEMELGRR